MPAMGCSNMRDLYGCMTEAWDGQAINGRLVISVMEMGIEGEAVPPWMSSSGCGAGGEAWHGKR